MPEQAVAPSSPDAKRYVPIVVLKEGSHSVATLVREAGGKKLLVARKIIGFPPKPDLAEPRIQKLLPLSHPNLQPIASLEYDSEATWVLSPFVPGYPMDQRPAVKKLALSWAILWITQMLELMEYLHAQDPPFCVGRIEPSDVVLADRGAVLVDLGAFERMLPKSARAEALLTPSPFMAPEQVESWAYNPKSDIFSVGALSWWMMTGEAPDLGGARDLAEVTKALQDGAPHMSDELIEPFAYMLANVAQRPSATELLDVLRPWTWQPRPQPAVPPPFLVAPDKGLTPWISQPTLETPGPTQTKAASRRLSSPPAAAVPSLTVRSATTDAVPLGELTPELGAYRPLARLHTNVSLVKHLGSGRLLVARRLLPPPGSNLEEAFVACETQLQVLGRASHAALQKTVQTIAQDDAFWVLCDYVLGWPADRLPESMPRPYGVICRWMSQLLEGVQELHRCGLAVGRMEVSDVVLAPSGPVLVDLRFMERTFRTQEREDERRLAVQADPGSDVRSIAAVGYWLLSGMSGFAHDSKEYTGLQVQLTKLKGVLPSELRKALLRLLHNEEVRRPRSVPEALELLSASVDLKAVAELPAVTPENPTPWLPSEAPVTQ